MTVAFDTDVFLYALDHSAGDRQARARELFRRAAFSPSSAVVALQCLGELVQVASRRLGLPVEEARDVALRWGEAFEVRPAVPGDLWHACEAAADQGLPFWDAMLWATLRRSGVTHLLSEGLPDGRELGGVCFVDPFAPHNDALIDLLLPAADLG